MMRAERNISIKRNQIDESIDAGAWLLMLVALAIGYGHAICCSSK
jgi:hypothetical protein